MTGRVLTSQSRIKVREAVSPVVWLDLFDVFRRNLPTCH